MPRRYGTNVMRLSADCHNRVTDIASPATASLASRVLWLAAVKAP
jgi:hypothetical protein